MDLMKLIPTALEHQQFFGGFELIRFLAIMMNWMAFSRFFEPRRVAVEASSKPVFTVTYNLTAPFQGLVKACTRCFDRARRGRLIGEYSVWDDSFPHAFMMERLSNVDIEPAHLLEWELYNWFHQELFSTLWESQLFNVMCPDCCLPGYITWLDQCFHPTQV